MRSPALISTSSKAGCYAVLASLSGRYPPLEGRSPTCYSPVCHATNPLRDFRVRLACVRHAASVDSEPGSNSHVKFAVPPLIRCAPNSMAGTTQLTRGRFIGSCVVQSVLIESGSSPVAFARTEDSGRPLDAMPPADSHCLSLPVARFARDRAARRFGKIDGLCVLARLSSFQRTDGNAPVTPYPTSHSLPPPRSRLEGLAACRPRRV